MVEHAHNKRWDELLNVLAKEGEVHLSDLEFESNSERERLKRVLRHTEELGWVEQTDTHVWEPGWKAEMFLEPDAADEYQPTP